MNLYQRAKAPTPKIFRTLRTAGLLFIAVSGSLLTAPIALPAFLVSSAGYLAVAGSVLAAVSQITVDTKRNTKKTKKEAPNGI